MTRLRALMFAIICLPMHPNREPVHRVLEGMMVVTRQLESLACPYLDQSRPVILERPMRSKMRMDIMSLESELE